MISTIRSLDDFAKKGIVILCIFYILGMDAVLMCMGPIDRGAALFGITCVFILCVYTVIKECLNHNKFEHRLAEECSDTESLERGINDAESGRTTKVDDVDKFLEEL